MQAEPTKPKSAERLAPGHRFAADVRGQAFIADGFTERFQFGFLTLGHQFHAAIRQVSDRAAHIKSRGHRPRRVAKPDALHASRIQDRHADPAHRARASLSRGKT